MMLLPPALISTTTGWPTWGPRPFATARATISTVPPAGFGTTRCSGLVGNSPAPAARGIAKPATASVRDFVIVSLPSGAPSFAFRRPGYNPAQQQITCDGRAHVAQRRTRRDGSLPARRGAGR